MKKSIRDFYSKTSLAAKIRFSYAVIFVPVIILFIIIIASFANSNRRYENMIRSLSAASDFSLDFKKDYDYETYLVIIGNKTPAESSLESILTESRDIIKDLEELTTSQENRKNLESIKKYLENLDDYRVRIAGNVAEPNGYDQNIEIWENDVQIVTGLISDTVNEYIHAELKELQTTRQEYQAVFERLISILIAASVIIGIFVAAMSYYIPRSITRPIAHIRQVTDQVARGDLSVRVETSEGIDISALGESLNTMIQEINDLLDQVRAEQVRLRKAQIRLLQAQINPHFLYNTLDTIVWLAESGDQKMVVSMVGSLSDFFRTSLNDGKDIITMEEELQHVRSYLQIQQVRYQDIMEYDIDIPSDVLKFSIPKITLQPLVENALYHGIKNKRGKGRISIIAKKSGDDFIITVEDNGKGMSEERLSEVCAGIRDNKHIENDIYGIYNVNERIRMSFGDRYGLSFESVYEEGTKVTILLPCRV